MQFKPQGRRVQVLAYAGYDKDKKRAIVKMLGSYDSYNLEPSDGLINNLTDEQKTELQSHFEEVRQSREKESLQQRKIHGIRPSPRRASPQRRLRGRRRNGSMRSWPASKS